MTIAQMQMRRGTAAQWTSANPILADGEWGLETDTGLTKLGLGGVAWNSLSYYQDLLWANAALTGTPTAPTPAAGDDDTSIATTAFVRANVQPYCQIEASAATNIPQNAYTKVDLATTVHTEASFFTVAASVITVIVTGIYDMSAWGGFGGGSSGNRYFGFSKNGLTDHTPGEAGTVADTGFYTTISGLAVPLTAGDTIQLVAFQSGNAGGLNTWHSAGVNVARLAIRKVG